MAPLHHPLRRSAFITHSALLLCAAAALSAPGPAHAGLGYDEALRLARERSPALLAQQHALGGAQAQQPAAGTLPDPRLSVGVENLPIGGPDRYTLTRDFMTMQRIAVMQEVPNAPKRAARVAGAQARIDRERTMLAVAELAVKRDAALAWVALYYAQARAAQLAELLRENTLLQDTLDSRIANGKAMPADRTMARQDALMLADRQDDLQRDIAKARASLRRWVGARADEPMDGAPPTIQITPDQTRADMHRHAEIAPYAPMQAMARAEASEADAEQRGDWAWELAYQRRGAQYGDMLSFQLTFDLPWNRDQRQRPQLAAKLKDVERIEAEREDTMRKHREELDAQLAELQALDAQRARLEAQGLPLATERIKLQMASYEAGRSDLGAVLTARRDAVELRLRLLDLDAQRTALRVRLTTLIAE